MTVKRFLVILKNDYKKVLLCTKIKIAKMAYDQVTFWPNILLDCYKIKNEKIYHNNNNNI